MDKKKTQSKSEKKRTDSLQADQKKSPEQKADQVQSEQKREWKYPEGQKKVRKLREKAHKIVEDNPAEEGEKTFFVPVVNMALTQKQYNLLFE